MTNHLIRQILNGEKKILNSYELEFIINSGEELIQKYSTKELHFKKKLEETSLDTQPAKRLIKPYIINHNRLHDINEELNQKNNLEDREVYDLEIQYDNCLNNLNYIQDQIIKILKQSGLDITQPTDWQFNKWVLEEYNLNELQNTIQYIKTTNNQVTSSDVFKLATLINQFYKHQIPFKWVVGL